MRDNQHGVPRYRGGAQGEIVSRLLDAIYASSAAGKEVKV